LSILNIHALTSYDTTNAIFVIGKKIAYLTFEKLSNEEFQQIANLQILSAENALDSD